MIPSLSSVVLPIKTACLGMCHCPTMGFFSLGTLKKSISAQFISSFDFLISSLPNFSLIVPELVQGDFLSLVENVAQLLILSFKEKRI